MHIKHLQTCLGLFGLALLVLSTAACDPIFGTLLGSNDSSAFANNKRLQRDHDIHAPSEDPCIRGAVERFIPAPENFTEAEAEELNVTCEKFEAGGTECCVRSFLTCEQGISKLSGVRVSSSCERGWPGADNKLCCSTLDSDPENLKSSSQVATLIPNGKCENAVTKKSPVTLSGKRLIHPFVTTESGGLGVETSDCKRYYNDELANQFFGRSSPLACGGAVGSSYNKPISIRISQPFLAKAYVSKPIPGNRDGNRYGANSNVSRLEVDQPASGNGSGNGSGNTSSGSPSGNSGVGVTEEKTIRGYHLASDIVCQNGVYGDHFGVFAAATGVITCAHFVPQSARDSSMGIVCLKATTPNGKNLIYYYLHLNEDWVKKLKVGDLVLSGDKIAEMASVEEYDKLEDFKLYMGRHLHLTVATAELERARALMGGNAVWQYESYLKPAHYVKNEKAPNTFVDPNEYPRKPESEKRGFFLNPVTAGFGDVEVSTVVNGSIFDVVINPDAEVNIASN